MEVMESAVANGRGVTRTARDIVEEFRSFLKARPVCEQCRHSRSTEMSTCMGVSRALCARCGHNEVPRLATEHKAALRREADRIRLELDIAAIEI